LSKHYGRVAALTDLTLAIQPGEVFGLLGPNGSGKTTLIRLLLGYLRATRGAATIGGRDCFRESVAVHAGLSYLPGDVRLVRGLPARDVLTLFARFRGERTPTRAVNIADRLRLDLARRTGQMSTGMRQKLALAVVFAVDAPLLILDEPTSNLDPTVRGTVLELVREARAAGRTVIFSSHVLSEIEQGCTRVGILGEGRLVHDQVMSQIRRGHRIRADLTAEMPALPHQFAEQVSVTRDNATHVTIDARGELAPLLGWLATLPVATMHIEPIGLQAVYEQYHGAQASSAESAA
jgi:beta-exotoxin I transport system ATP-binding protein